MTTSFYDRIVRIFFRRLFWTPQTIKYFVEKMGYKQYYIHPGNDYYICEIGVDGYKTIIEEMVKTGDGLIFSLA